MHVLLDARVALDAIKGSLTIAQLVAKHGAHQTLINAWTRQAIEWLSHRDYDVIILDIILPKVSGIDVMDFLRQTKPAALQKIIVVTGVDVKEIQRLYPVFQAIGKPVLPSRLRSWVRKCVEAEPARALSR